MPRPRSRPVLTPPALSPRAPQIEHHLFPSMPQFRHRLIAPRVRALLHKHDLPYDCRSYASAMRATFANLHNVGAEVFYG